MGVALKRDKAAITRVANHAAQDWQLKPDVKELDDCESVVFKAYKQDGMPLILRVTEPSHRTSQAMKAELDYVNFLKSEGMGVCASLVCPLDGEKVRTYTDNQSGNEYHVYVTEFAEGAPIDFEKDWNVGLAKQLGTMVAKFKKANIKFNQNASKRHSYFDSEHVKNALKYIPKDHKEAVEEWKLAHAWVSALDRTAEDFGVCHTDMHAGNFFITDKGDITVFDFDDACYNFYLYDAMILFMIDNLKEKKLTNPTPEEYQDIYLKAYADELGITNLNKIRHDLKNFERLRSIEMYAWVYLMGYDKDNDMDAWRKKFTPDVPFKNYSA